MSIFQVKYKPIRISMTESEIRDLFGHNLKRLRKARNISQIQLAEKTGMAFTFINAIENGKKWISPESMAKVATALNVEAYQFFMPKDYNLKLAPNLESFARELEQNIQLVKSRYGIL